MNNDFWNCRDYINTMTERNLICVRSFSINREDSIDIKKDVKESN